MFPLIGEHLADFREICAMTPSTSSVREVGVSMGNLEVFPGLRRDRLQGTLCGHLRESHTHTHLHTHTDAPTQIVDIFPIHVSQSGTRCWKTTHHSEQHDPPSDAAFNGRQKQLSRSIGAPCFATFTHPTLTYGALQRDIVNFSESVSSFPGGNPFQSPDKHVTGLMTLS